MSDICTIKKSTLDGIAEAIQSKTGESGGMLPSEMAGKIETLPSQPAKGLVFSEYDSDGYSHKAEFVGNWTEIPRYYCYNLFSQRASVVGKITNIDIPQGVTRINDEAFRGFSNISISLPEGLLVLGAFSFYQTDLTAFRLPSTVTTIGRQVFRNARLNSFSASRDLNSIEDLAFMNCTSLAEYDFSMCSNIPSLYSAGSLGHASGCVIKIPLALSDQTLGAGNGWESATNWVALTNVTWEAV